LFYTYEDGERLRLRFESLGYMIEQYRSVIEKILLSIANAEDLEAEYERLHDCEEIRSIFYGKRTQYPEVRCHESCKKIDYYT